MDPIPKAFERFVADKDLVARNKALFGPKGLFPGGALVPASWWLAPIHHPKARKKGSAAFRVFLERAFSPAESDAEKNLWSAHSRLAFLALLEEDGCPRLPSLLPWRVFALLGRQSILQWAAAQPDPSEAINRLDCEGRDLMETAFFTHIGSFANAGRPIELDFQEARALGYDFSGASKPRSSIHPLYQAIRAYYSSFVPLLLSFGADPRQKILMERDDAGFEMQGREASVLALAKALLSSPWLNPGIREDIQSSVSLLQARSESLDMEDALSSGPSAPRSKPLSL